MSDQPIGYLLCDELMFTSRITSTARDLGLTIKPARSMAVLRQLAEQQRPVCVILDLANPELDVPALVQGLCADQPRKPYVVAYGSHVDADTLRHARDAGCDLVLPRSKFVEELPLKLTDWMAGKG